ncbi:MAG: hypothetical protein V1904_04530 [Bacteroidota bacterium]
MKKIFTLLVITAIIASGCVSSGKLMQKGRYDQAINKSVKKLLKNPEKVKELTVLASSYKLANQKDLDNITFLKKTGEPDIWDKIFATYSTMKIRQEKVKVLSDDILGKMGFEYVNYDNNIIEAKKKAAEYFYVHAQSLLALNDRDNARKAYYELEKVKSYYASYRDCDSLVSVALEQGTAYVLFKMQNATTLLLPADFESLLTKISMADLDQLWISYDTRQVEGRNYAYVILMNIKAIDVSPEYIKEIQYTESKEVQDGYTYLLDSLGNVMHDSLGNDIKIPKYKTISCIVTETQQKKTAIVSGTLDYLSAETEDLIKTDPVTAETCFENYFARANGDLDALSDETKKKIGNSYVPFPSNPGMILLAGEVLKDMVKDIVWKYKSLLS